MDLDAISPDGQVVDVIIVNDSPSTGSAAQVMSLQEKIHTYVRFALDGQMAATYPRLTGLRGASSSTIRRARSTHER